MLAVYQHWFNVWCLLIYLDRWAVFVHVAGIRRACTLLKANMNCCLLLNAPDCTSVSLMSTLISVLSLGGTGGRGKVYSTPSWPNINNEDVLVVGSDDNVSYWTVKARCPWYRLSRFPSKALCSCQYVGGSGANTSVSTICVPSTVTHRASSTKLCPSLTTESSSNVSLDSDMSTSWAVVMSLFSLLLLHSVVTPMQTQSRQPYSCSSAR